MTPANTLVEMKPCWFPEPVSTNITDAVEPWSLELFSVPNVSSFNYEGLLQRLLNRGRSFLPDDSMAT